MIIKLNGLIESHTNSDFIKKETRNHEVDIPH